MSRRRTARKQTASPAQTPSQTPSPSPSKASRPNGDDSGGVDSGGVEDKPGATAPVDVKRKEVLFPQLPSLSRIMSVVMLMMGILAVGVLFYQLMIGFFVPLFLAALLVVIFRPVHDWLLRRLGGRRRVAAGLTTAMILLMVLMPAGVIVSVATTQFTIVLAQLNLGSMTSALDRVRGQFSLSLEHPEHFRQLDQIADSLGIAGAGDEADQLTRKAGELDNAAAIVRFLQEDMGQTPESVVKADEAISQLNEFADQLRRVEKLLAVRSTPETGDSEANASESGVRETDDFDVDASPRVVADPAALVRLNVNEQFEQNAVVSAAAIRSWMHTVLGGALRSQLRLLANPGEADFASLIRKARETLQPRFVRLTSATGSILVQLIFGILILVVSVYFFLIDGAVMIRTLMRLSPMDDAYEHQLLMEFDRTSRAVVLASALSAVVQGILATLGFWLCGFDQIVLLLFITTLMALVPFLGAASVWVPCALWLGMVDQRWGAATLLAIYGALVVSSIDNVIKVFVLHGRSQLHPLFALLSVIGGVTVFGPIGILVGPMVVVFLQTLLEILNHELRSDAATA